MKTLIFTNSNETIAFENIQEDSIYYYGLQLGVSKGIVVHTASGFTVLWHTLYLTTVQTYEAPSIKLLLIRLHNDGYKIYVTKSVNELLGWFAKKD